MTFENIKKALGSGGIVAFGYSGGASVMLKWIKRTHGLHTYSDTGEKLKKMGSIENIGSFENDEASKEAVLKAIKERLNSEQGMRIYEIKKI